MSLVRFLLWSSLAALVVVVGVVLGTGVAGAVMGPAVEQRLTETPAADRCPVEVHHEVGFDAGSRTYALRAVQVSAPTCPPATRVSVAIDGRVIGVSTLDDDGCARLELVEPVPAAGVRELQVSTVN